MAQSNETKPEDRRPDIGSCRVCRMANGSSVCMMDKDCPYALPFGNICSHPMVGMMANAGPCVK